MKYIAIDTETGGIGSEVSLLTMYLGIFDVNLQFIEGRHDLIKPEDGIYRVQAQGMGINKIDLVAHDAQAKLLKVVQKEVGAFLMQHSNNGQDKLIPVGHNVKFDIIKICDVVVPPRTWNHCVSYRNLDTGVIAQYLKLLGKLPESISGSLSSLIEHFGIQHSGALHNAETDALMTVEVLKGLKDVGSA